MKSTLPSKNRRKGTLFRFKYKLKGFIYQDNVAIAVNALSNITVGYFRGGIRSECRVDVQTKV